MDNVRTIEFAQYGVTNFHPLAIVFMVCMTVLALAPKRSGVTLSILAVCVFMPSEQRIVIAGVDLSMLRCLMLLAWIRVVARAEYRGLTFGRLDRLLLLWVVCASLFHVLRVGPSGIVYRLGVSFDALSAYFLIRVLVRRRGDLLVLWKQVAWITIVLSPFLLFEALALYNFFGIFDYAGVDIVDVRSGRPRAQGPFSHPILAGTFGSVVLPVFVGVLLGSKEKPVLFRFACVGAIIVVLAAGSSGPVMGCVVGGLGWAIWRFRKYTRHMMWAAFGAAVVIHFVREKPVWHLIGRLSSVTGGTGYHRYRLIDAFISRFDEWVLVGTDNTAYWGWGLQDITNFYISQGVRGGLVTFVLFIVLLRASFLQLRLARTRFERRQGPRSFWALFGWGSSVSLAVHCVSFLSVAYFGQMFSIFVFFLATIPTYATFRRAKRSRSTAEVSSARVAKPVPA